jgi:hypothetical protein
MQVSWTRRVGLLLWAGLLTLTAWGAAPPPRLLPWQRVLRGADAAQAAALESRLERSWQAGDFTDATEAARELARLRASKQGADHWQAVDAHWKLVAMERAGKASPEAREAFRTLPRMDTQANELFAKRQYTQAMSLVEKMLVIQRQVLEEHPDTALSYNNLAFVLNALGRHTDAHQPFEKSLAIRHELLGEKHPLTALSYNTLARNLRERGQRAAARRLNEKALAINLEVLGEEHYLTATSYYNLAFDLEEEGQPALAQPLREKALAINRKVLGEEHAGTAASYNNLAHNLDAQGRHRAAQRLYEKTLALNRKVRGEEHPDTAISYNHLAANLSRQGQYADARPLLETALAIRRKLLGEEHPDTAKSYSDLAAILSQQGQYAAAQPLAETALALRRKMLGEEHIETALSCTTLASVLGGQGQHAAAQRLFEKALPILLRVQGEEYPETSLIRNNLAGNLDKQGRHSAAQRLYEKTLALRRKLPGEKHPHTALSCNNLASNLSAQGQLAAAQRLFEHALAIRLEVLGEEHPHTATAYKNLALNLAAQGHYARAEQCLTRAAHSFSRARLRAATPGFERVFFGGNDSSLVTLAATLARNGKPVEAWQRFDESLALSTQEELAARLRWSPAELDRLEQLRGRLDNLDRLIQNTLTAPNDTPQLREERERLLGQRRAAADELHLFRQEMEKRDEGSAGRKHDRAALQKALPADTAFVAWIDLRAQPGAKDPSGEHWAVLLRNTGDPIWARVRGSGPDGVWTPGDRLLPARLLQELTSPRGERRALAERLRRQRVGPLEPHLTGIRHLLVLPSDHLAGLPVEVLADSRTVSYVPSPGLFLHLRQRPPVRTTGVLALADPSLERRPAASPPLPPGGLLVRLVGPGSNAQRAGIRPGDVLLTYAGRELNSLDELRRLTDAPARGGEVELTVWRHGETRRASVPPGKLGVVLHTLPARQALQQQHDNDRLLARARGDDETWQPLPGTRLETQALAQLLGEKEVTLLAGSAASEQRLDELAHSGQLQHYRYLHLATHGVVDTRLPLQSALLLARDELPDPLRQLQAGQPVYDGRLTAEEVLRRWKLDSELVTLSACQTALGKHEPGEGHLGFPQAFLLAGSRSVLVSLWKVDDTATALFMDRFYQNLLGKRAGLRAPLAKAEALAEARSWLRGLSRAEALRRGAELAQGVERGAGRPKLPLAPQVPPAAAGVRDEEARPFAHPYYWAAFVLVGRHD